ncbi:Conserved oligomeric Golgi complex subunit 1 [Balamuthia mandrillaris]
MQARTRASGESALEYEARQLFERHTVDEIRVRESSTRQDIEDKKQELRKLVGARYRDLIDSADSVIAMKHAALNACQKLEDIQRDCKHLFSALQSDSHSNNNHSKKWRGSSSSSLLRAPPQLNSDEKAKDRQRYHVALHIKSLVDAPEQIWSKLEDDDYFTATMLYSNAERVHSNLTTDKASTRLLTQIPLVTRQWSLISQFPTEIKQKSHAKLHSTKASSQHYAGALCSLILLGALPPKDAFLTFLNSQRTAILSLFDDPRLSLPFSSTITPDNPSSSPSHQVSQVLGCVAAAVQCTLFHVGAIFVEPFATSTCYGAPSSLLPMLLREFASSPSTLQEGKQKYVLDLSSDVCASKSKEWLQELSTNIRTKTKALLSASITKAMDLAAVQEQLQEAVEAPPFPPCYTTTSSSSSEIVFSASSNVWREICANVLDKQIGVWELLFRDVFLETAKDIIRSSFSTLQLSVLDKRLSSVTEEDSLGEYVWKSQPSLEPFSSSSSLFSVSLLPITTQQQQQTRTTRTTVAEWKMFELEVVQDLDTQLSAIMQDINHVLTSSSNQVTEEKKHKELEIEQEEQQYWQQENELVESKNKKAKQHGWPSSSSGYLQKMEEESNEEQETREVIEAKEKKRKEQEEIYKALLSFVQDTCLEATLRLYKQLDELVERLQQQLIASVNTTTHNTEKETRRKKDSTMQFDFIDYENGNSNNDNFDDDYDEAEEERKEELLYRATIEQLLFIARVSRGISEKSSQLPIIFTSYVSPSRETEDSLTSSSSSINLSLRQRLLSKNWNSQQSDSSSSLSAYLLSRKKEEEERRKRKKRRYSANWRRLRCLLRKLYLRANRLWSRWLSDRLALRLRRGLATERWDDSSRQLGWQPFTVVLPFASPDVDDEEKKEKEERNEKEETQVFLPCQPSPYVLSILFKACQEIHKANAYCPDEIILHYFVRKLACNVWDVYSDLVSALEAEATLLSEEETVSSSKLHNKSEEEGEERKQLQEDKNKEEEKEKEKGETAHEVNKKVDDERLNICKEGCIQLLFDTSLLLDIIGGGEAETKDLRRRNSHQQNKSKAKTARSRYGPYLTSTITRSNEDDDEDYDDDEEAEEEDNEEAKQDNTGEGGRKSHSSSGRTGVYDDYELMLQLEKEEGEQEKETTSDKSSRTNADALLNRLLDLLDPIDRAFYQPHISDCVKQCYCRCSSLLGFLVQLNRLHSDVKYKPIPNERHNLLPLVTPPAPRLRYLPITDAFLLSDEDVGRRTNPIDQTSLLLPFGESTDSELLLYRSLANSNIAVPSLLSSSETTKQHLLQKSETKASHERSPSGDAATSLSFMEQMGKRFGSFIPSSSAEEPQSFSSAAATSPSESTGFWFL